MDAQYQSTDSGSIKDIARKCTDIFEDLIGRESKALRQNLENRLADFRLWADGVGAMAHGRKSLDSKFDKRQDDLRIVKHCLQLLEIFLLDYGSGQPDDETRIVLADIDSALGNLARLGLAIRDTGKASRAGRADRSYDPEDHNGFKRYMQCLVLFRPSENGRKDYILDDTQLSQLQRRLIECNMRRRNRFIVAQNHSKYLKTKKEDRGSGSPSPTIALKPPEGPREKGSAGRRVEGAGVRFALDKQFHERPAETPLSTSEVSKASTAEAPLLWQPTSTRAKSTLTAIASENEFPRPPRFEAGRLIVRCPCCCQSLPTETVKSSDSWK